MSKLDIKCAFDKIDELENISPKNRNCLKLLTEELFSMTEVLLNSYDSEFVIRKTEGTYEICLNVEADVNKSQREQFVSISSKKENADRKGLKGKIVDFIEDFFLIEDPAAQSLYGVNYDYLDYTAAWSMNYYMNAVPHEESKKV